MSSQQIIIVLHLNTTYKYIYDFAHFENHKNRLEIEKIIACYLSD